MNGLNETLDICDESGETVGHFLPADVYRKMQYQVAEAQCPHTKEELAEMRKQKGGGRTLAEFWKEMGRT